MASCSLSSPHACTHTLTHHTLTHTLTLSQFLFFFEQGFDRWQETGHLISHARRPPISQPFSRNSSTLPSYPNHSGTSSLFSLCLLFICLLSVCLFHPFSPPYMRRPNGYDPPNGFGNPLVCSASVGVASSASSNIPAPASTNTHFAVRWDPRADAQAIAFIRGIVLPVGYHSREPHHACDRQQSLPSLEALP